MPLQIFDGEGKEDFLALADCVPKKAAISALALFMHTVSFVEKRMLCGRGLEFVSAMVV